MLFPFVMPHIWFCNLYMDMS
uniref:Uncharacterized protein n=1 Tax=Arundo donax TaxID=35708 RepID=A0A0A8YBI5_ARUDO